ncbi:glycosyltransferase [Pseudomonas entomophila]|uniref:glycosyltransferase n=1 Tax=Pseudomonas entomophila TaxID=312306 RepID=UPI003EC04C99
MKKHILIAIRYSILQKNSGAWRATNSNFEDYVSKVLKDARLDIRENTFENITLRSLSDQNNNDPDVSYSVLIMVADMLPAHRIANLEKLASIIKKPRTSYEIVKIESGTGLAFDYKNINDAIKATLQNKLKDAPNTLVATVRLDDDDGVSNNFISKLSTHMRPGLAGYAVSFAHGIEGYWEDNGNYIKDLKHSYFPKCAQALAYLNEYDAQQGMSENKTIHVYNLGNHMKIDERFPTIVDATEPMYFRTLSTTNDSVGSPYHKHMPSVQGMNTLENFGYVAKLYRGEPIPEVEDLTALEVCKTSSPWMALINHLNNRIQLREKQIRELTDRLEKNQ